MQKLRVNTTAIMLLEVTMAKIFGFCGALWLIILDFYVSQHVPRTVISHAKNIKIV